MTTTAEYPTSEQYLSNNGYMLPYYVAKRKTTAGEDYVIVDSRGALVKKFGQDKQGAHAQVLERNSAVKNRLRKLDRLENIPEAHYLCVACQEYKTANDLYSAFYPSLSRLCWLCHGCTVRLELTIDSHSLEFFLAHHQKRLLGL